VEIFSDGATKKIGKTFEKAVRKSGLTKAGRLNKKVKKIVKSLGKKVTRSRTANIKSGLKKAGKYGSEALEKTPAPLCWCERHARIKQLKPVGL